MTDQDSPLNPTTAFATLGGMVGTERPLQSVLETLVHLAKRVLPPAVEASVTLVNGDEALTAAFSGRLAINLDEKQYELDRGPCLDASRTGQVVMIAEMAEDTRWPEFAAAAHESGVGSSLSVPLPVRRQVTGALNIYAAAARAFDAETVDLAQSFASHAAVAVATARLSESSAALAEQMQQAMASRAVIEQAKGILMRDRGCTADEAFEVLVTLSQTAHMKLREVASRLVDEVAHGRLPRQE